MTDYRDRTFNDLIEENIRLKQGAPEAAQVGSAKTTVLVWAAVALSIATIIAIAAVTIARPEKDSTGIITTLLGFVVPSVLALIGAAVQQVHLAVNSRLTQLINLTARSAKAEGRLAGAALVQTDFAAVGVAREEGKAAGVEQERTRPPAA